MGIIQEQQTVRVEIDPGPSIPAQVGVGLTVAVLAGLILWGFRRIWRRRPRRYRRSDMIDPSNRP
tara:strand:- start:3934 stop:4128 length:195 start_codon:yes stop_codon:yes gene_type:complete